MPGLPPLPGLLRNDVARGDVWTNGRYTFVTPSFTPAATGGLLGTLIDEETGKRTVLSRTGCGIISGSEKVGARLPAPIGGQWLLFNCASGSRGYLALYGLATGQWQDVPMAPRIEAFQTLCRGQGQCGAPAIAVGSDWVEFVEQCYHCANTYVFQNLHTGQVANNPADDATTVDLNAPTLAYVAYRDSGQRQQAPPPAQSPAPLALASPPASAAASTGTPGYGLAEAIGRCAGWNPDLVTCGNWGYGFPKYTSPGDPQNGNYQTLKNGLPIRYARFFVPWDALGYFNGSACAFSPAYVTGGMGSDHQARVAGQDWNVLIAEIQSARREGLTPLVVFQDGTGIGGLPGAIDYTTPGHTNNYMCGVQAVMFYTSAAGAPVSEWEAWNEPDGNPTYRDPGGIGPGTGTYKAAYLWALSNYLAGYLHGLGLPSMTVTAGTFTHPSTGYFDSYFMNLNTIVGSALPTLFSFHDYNDLGAWFSYFPLEAIDFAISVRNHYNGVAQQPQLWITEAAADLTFSINRYHGQPVSCVAAGDNDNINTLGACVDNNPGAQDSAGRAFLNLSLAGVNASQISRVYWYQLQPENPSTGFDSGLISPDGTLRQSFCRLANLPSSSCSSSTYEASDFSTPSH